MSVLCAGVCALLGAAGGAKAEPISLLSPVAQLQPPPPLLQGASTIESPPEIRFPGQLQNRERVAVGLGDDGSATRISVTQRLLISLQGDFAFIVPAPATSVAPAPGTDAQPGLRDLGIVWQGFSSGHRELAATAALSVTAARAGLPLAVAVRPTAGGTTVTLTNIARRSVSYAAGSVLPGEAVRALKVIRGLQRRAGRGAIAGIGDVDGTPHGQVTAMVIAPLRVRGSLRVPGRSAVPVDVLLGQGRSTKTLTLPGRVSPRVELRVVLLPALEILPRPRELAAAPNPLAALQESLARLALSWQFRHYLASPDQLGPSSTAYVYRTVAATAQVVPVKRDEGSGGDTLAIVLAATLGGAALLGLAVFWAYS